ncbi:MAG: hypothetical protein AAF741_03495 [Bacteroidota bacterium]
MKLSLPLFALLTLSIICFSACEDNLVNLGDIDEVRYEAEYAIPLIDSEINMNDLLENFEEDASLTVDPDGLLRFQYRGDVLSRDAEDIFRGINATINDFPFIPLLEQRQALPFSVPGGLELDRLIIGGGTLRYGIINQNDFPVTATIRFPTITLDGEPLEISGELPAFDGTGDPPVLSNIGDEFDPFDITGYLLLPEDDSIFIESFLEDADGNLYDPTPGSGVAIDDFAFEYAEGFLDNLIYEGGRDTIEIDFFDSWIRGDVFFENPRITFNIDNSFGVPTESVINVFNIITADGDTLPLESVFLEDGIAFPYPELDEIGEIKSREFVFTPENSNIDIVLGSQPVAVDYDVNALTNPDNDTSIRGFITDSSFYRVQVEVELPLDGSAADFEVRDTFEIDFSQFDEAQEVEFKLVSDNELPLGVRISGAFQDEAGNFLANFLPEEEQLIGPAPVGPDGRPTEPLQQITFVEYDAETLPSILDAKQLVLTAFFDTTNGSGQSVRIEENQDLRVRLGARVKVNN